MPALTLGRNGSRSINAALGIGTARTVATLPAASSCLGQVAYVSNGAAGAPCAAISDGTNWKVIALGATVAASLEDPEADDEGTPTDETPVPGEHEDPECPPKTKSWAKKK